MYIQYVLTRPQIQTHRALHREQNYVFTKPPSSSHTIHLSLSVSRGDVTGLRKQSQHIWRKWRKKNHWILWSCVCECMCVYPPCHNTHIQRVKNVFVVFIFKFHFLIKELYPFHFGLSGFHPRHNKQTCRISNTPKYRHSFALGDTRHGHWEVALCADLYILSWQWTSSRNG